MGKVEKRRNSIIELLHKNPSLTQSDLSDLLNVSLRTVKGDYEYLRSQGFILNSIKSKEKYLNTENISLTKNNEDAMKELLVLYYLSAKGLTIDEMCSLEYPDYPPAARATLFRKILPLLVDNNLLNKDQRHYTANNISFTVLPDDDNELLNFSLYCLSTGHAFGKHIYEKSLDYLTKNNIILHSNTEPAFNRLPFYTQVLKRNAAHNSPIAFLYKGKPIHFFFLGFIAYSSEKDAVYLIGRSKPTKTEIKAFRADQIDWTSVHKIKEPNFSKAMQNNSHASKIECYFKRFQAELFGISEDQKTEHVVIKIRYSYENYLDIHHLYAFRKKQWEKFDYAASLLNIDDELSQHYSPKLTFTDDSGNSCSLNSINIKYITYSDHILGLSNFANYLRRFGSDAIVIENEKLKKIILSGAQRALSHYSNDNIGGKE